MAVGTSLDEHRLARLIEVGRGLLSELDLDVVLDRVLETALELTGARYAAVGVLDERRQELERFVTRGVDEATHRSIGDLPRGRGILGVLIHDPRPLRLTDVGAHPRSYGFPTGHPPMRTFLGVPILVRGRAWGNLYLTEKEAGAEFEPEDEDALVILADWAAIAVENARLYAEATARRDALEQAVRRLQATATIARAVGGETELGRVLELVVKRGRALVEARTVFILLRDGDDLEIVAGAGETGALEHVHVPVAGSTAGEILAEGRPRRIDDVAADLRLPVDRPGLPEASSALLVPLLYRGAGLGVLVAFDRLAQDTRFSAEDEGLLDAFAAQAATAVAGARTVAVERLRRSIEAAEAERRRWARELHDETLQGLAGLKVLLAGALAGDDAAALRQATAQAIEHVGRDLQALRAIIADLRPAALDELGLGPALRGLAERTGVAAGLDVRTRLELAENPRPAAETETTAFRIVQEALTNAVRHAGASTIDVDVRDNEDGLTVAVADDGAGFDVAAPAGGYGLVGMRERAELAGGTLEVGPRAGGGTTVRARFPRQSGGSSRPRSSA
jgi:signal transduction histidine kinase